MASTDKSYSLGVLTCTVDIEPITHTSGQLVLTISRTKGQEAAFCDTLVIAVPIGPKAEDFFSYPPTIRSNQRAWAPSSYLSSTGTGPDGLVLKAVNPDGTAAVGTDYQYFVIKNQTTGQGLDAASFPLELTLTGTVNAVKGKPVLLVQETSQSSADKGFGRKNQTFIPLRKVLAHLLYIDSFYASTGHDQPATTTNPGKSAADPTTRFRSGEPFVLSWESNGSRYELYQDDELVTPKEGEATSHAVAEGIAADTTFVLMAHGKNDVNLYASLTVTVSNPIYGPEILTAKRVLRRADNAVLVKALTATKVTAEQAADGRVKNAISGSIALLWGIWNTQDAELSEQFNLQYIRPDPFLRRPADPLPPGGEPWEISTAMLSRVNTSGLRRVLLHTSDEWVKNYLKEKASPELKAAFAPDIAATIADLLALDSQPNSEQGTLKDALDKLDTATLKVLFAPASDPEIKLALELLDKPSAGAVPLGSPDTDHCLRLSDGTPNGNILLQALSGNNAGLATLNFNGYFGGGDQQFNTAKARYRVGADQRGATDRFFIDAYSKGDAAPKPAFAILANGNVGIGLTNDPTATLQVARGTGADGTAVFMGSERWSHFNYSTDEHTYIRGGKKDSNVYLSDDGGNVGIGTTAPQEKLDVAGNIRATASIVVDASATNNGNDGNPDGKGLPGGALIFGGSGSGEGIGSQRTAGAGGNQYGLDIYTLYQKRISITQSGNVGIGIANPAQKLDVNGGAFINGYVGIGTNSPDVPLKIATANNNFWLKEHHYMSDGGTGHGREVGGLNVSVYAAGEMVASTFRAFSDARLKTIIGASDAATDLALLRRLRITDYTMRDRVQYGDQAFKKIIAQELEAVFPQAVRHHVDFLPTIYARPTQVQRQGENLLISLPTGLPEAATAGQRLKLMGPAGEVLSTLAVAAAAGCRQLLLSGANGLADTPSEVFVFGLEHPDVRTVDYEAVAMLNVSATQALARQVDELHQQNAALHAQCQTQGTQVAELRAALHLLQQQVAGLLRQPAGVAQH